MTNRKERIQADAVMGFCQRACPLSADGTRGELRAANPTTGPLLRSWKGNPMMTRETLLKAGTAAVVPLLSVPGRPAPTSLESKHHNATTLTQALGS